MSSTRESTLLLSGFADEIADDLETQLDALEELNLRYVDLRSVGGISVLDLGDLLLRAQLCNGRADIPLHSYGCKAETNTL